MRKSLGLLVAVAICAGLAGCSNGTAIRLSPESGVSANPSTTVPSEDGGWTYFVDNGPTATTPPTYPGGAQVLFVAPSSGTTGFNSPLLPVAQLSQAAQSDPRAACNTIEELYGAVPESYLHRLPIAASIYLPGCLIGQISALHSRTISRKSVVIGATTKSASPRAQSVSSG
jgi:hypothetical protein